MARANYVVSINNSIVYPISRMYTLTECEQLCKQFNRECGKNVYKAVKFTTVTQIKQELKNAFRIFRK